MELMQAHNNWATRPADERFLSLTDMLSYKRQLRHNSRAKVVPSKALQIAPTDETAGAGLVISGANGTGYAPTNWAFGQLAQLAGAPAAYLRTLPAAIAADAMNYGLQFNRQAEEVGVLLQRPATADGSIMVDGNTPAAPQLVAATGPKYGRIWDADVLAATVDRFGDGVTGRFIVPNERGNPHNGHITKANTTFYAGDRDMFIFLADEQNKIELLNRRGGEHCLLSRGVFMWNSEVGSKTFGIATFLYDDMCGNHIVWGAQEYKEIRIRHSSLAPDRFLGEIQPALLSYANSSTDSIVTAVEAARAKKIADTPDEVTAFLATRFGKGRAESIKTAHMLEEGRPIETLWDATVGATAVARSIVHIDARVDLERAAGDLLNLAA